jgi:plasmid stability protein
MKAIHIREIPSETIDALKRLARGNHRSLQGELRDILEKAARRAPVSDTDDDLDLVTVRTGSTSTWHREELYGDSGR